MSEPLALTPEWKLVNIAGIWTLQWGSMYFPVGSMTDEIVDFIQRCAMLPARNKDLHA